MADDQLFVVLTVIDHEHTMSTYSPQVAMVHGYESMEDAAVFNVGNHPDAQKQHGAYKRVIVIPFEQWKEFEIYSERVKGVDTFRAYPSEHPTIRSVRDARPELD